LDQNDLNPAQLAAAIRESLNVPMAKPQLDLNGAERSAGIIESMVTATPQVKAIAYHTGYEN